MRFTNFVSTLAVVCLAFEADAIRVELELGGLGDDFIDLKDTVFGGVEGVKNLFGGNTDNIVGDVENVHGLVSTGYDLGNHVKDAYNKKTEGTKQKDNQKGGQVKTGGEVKKGGQVKKVTKLPSRPYNEVTRRWDSYDWWHHDDCEKMIDENVKPAYEAVRKKDYWKSVKDSIFDDDWSHSTNRKIKMRLNQ